MPDDAGQSTTEPADTVAETPAPAPAAAPLRRRRRRAQHRRRALIRRALLATAGLALLLALVAGWYAWSLRTDYREAKATLDGIRAMVPNDGSGERLRAEQIPELSDRLAQLDAQVRHLQDQVDVPILSPIARRLPWAGPRVRAVEAFLDFGVAASSLARDSSQLGRDIYAAWQQTGFTGPADPNAPTWLGVVQENRAEIDDLLARFDALLIQRARLDEAHLPARATNMLASIDPLLDRAADARARYAGLLDYYPVVEEALGAGSGREDGESPGVPRDSRYIVLLLNSQEIRPPGGFPGTYAVITVNQGRLVEYTFHNILDLDARYVEHRTLPLAPPAPLAEFLKVQEWLPRDAAWSADFPTAAQTFLDMYAIAGGEPVDGVVAVTDVAVRDILRALGPLDVRIEGAPVTVDADNVIEVIESYRAGAGERHKEAVRVIGTALLDRIRHGGLAVQRAALTSIRDSADRREIQVYAISPSLQAHVVARGWDGALVPDPTQPTLGLTLANVVGNKASRTLFVDTELELTTAPNGATRVTWTIDIHHAGDPAGDTFYNGFHRTWLAVYLPAGSTLVRSDPLPEPAALTDDPRALGYHVPLDTGTTKRVRVVFDLPAGARELRLRRQAGANPLEVVVRYEQGHCRIADARFLDRDAVIDLESCMQGHLTRPDA